MYSNQSLSLNQKLPSCCFDNMMIVFECATLQPTAPNPSKPGVTGPNKPRTAGMPTRRMHPSRILRASRLSLQVYFTCARNKLFNFDIALATTG